MRRFRHACYFIVFAALATTVYSQRPAADPSVREVANAYFTTVDSLREKQARAFEGGAPRARIIRLRGHHFIVISNEADVMNEISAFLAGLK